MNCRKPEQMGTQGYAKNVEENSSPGRWLWYQQRRQEAEGLKDKREEIQEQSIRGF